MEDFDQRVSGPCGGEPPHDVAPSSKDEARVPPHKTLSSIFTDRPTRRRYGWAQPASGRGQEQGPRRSTPRRVARLGAHKQAWLSWL